MKKSIIASLFVIVLLSACKETETTTVDITGTATITGTVTADVDQTDGQSQSEILPGVNVRILWNSVDLAIISDGDDRRESLVVTTDSAGVYTAEVPTTEDGVTFDLEFDEVELDVTYNNGTENITESVVFSSGTATASVKIGETVTEDFDYESNFKPGTLLEEFGTITGVVEADTEQINTEEIPELAGGAPVTVKWTDNDGNERSISTTTNASGVYSVQVPTNDVDASNFTVVFEEYTTSIDYNDGFDNVTGFSVTYEEAEETNVAVSRGKEVTRNYNYDSNFKENLPTFAMIEGTVIARIDEIDDVDTPRPGVEVRISWTDDEGNTRGLFLTTDNSGQYSSKVPLANNPSTNFVVRFSEFTVSPYRYDDGGTEVTNATATYNTQTNNENGVAKGDEITSDRTFTTANSVEN